MMNEPIASKILAKEEAIRNLYYHIFIYLKTTLMLSIAKNLQK